MSKRPQDLPKSFAHWCRRHGIRWDGYTGTSCRPAHRAGLGDPIRHFRALPHLGLFQVCDGNFDRWANSLGGEVTMPRTMAEFDRALADLLAAAVVATPTPETVAGSIAWRIAHCEERERWLHDDYGDMAAWAAKHGRHGKWLRSALAKYESRLSGLRRERKRLKRRLARWVRLHPGAAAAAAA